MVNDTISDMLTRIRNGSLMRKESVSVPLTGQNLQICQILEREGFILSFKREIPRHPAPPPSVGPPKGGGGKGGRGGSGVLVQLRYKEESGEPSITNLKRVSKPGLRIYSGYQSMPKVLGGMGVLVLSTSRGIMTDREALFYRIGGEILCSIW